MRHAYGARRSKLYTINGSITLTHILMYVNNANAKQNTIWRKYYNTGLYVLRERLLSKWMDMNIH